MANWGDWDTLSCNVGPNGYVVLQSFKDGITYGNIVYPGFTVIPLYGGYTPGPDYYGYYYNNPVAVPNTGYRIKSFVFDGQSYPSGQGCPVIGWPVAALINIIFTVEFEEVVYYTITVTQELDGVIRPGTMVLEEGSNQNFIITPNSGFLVQDVLVDGISVGAITHYTFSNIQANHTITASFSYAYNAYYAFDQNLETFTRTVLTTLSESNPWSVMIDLGYPKLINKYKLTEAQGISSDLQISDWVFQGTCTSFATADDARNDNDWTDLDVRSGVISFDDYFTFTSGKICRYYRIRVTGVRGGGTDYHAYIGDIKLVEHQATPIVPNEHTRFLLHFDGVQGSENIVDSSVYNHPVFSEGGAHVDLLQSFSGGSSGYFVRDPWAYISSKFETSYDVGNHGGLGLNDFTVRFRINFSDLSYIIDESGIIWEVTGDNYVTFFIEKTSLGYSFKLKCHDNYSGGAVFVCVCPVSVLETNNWYHIAVVRYMNETSIYLDGISLTKTVDIQYTLRDNDGAFLVGGDTTGITGWIDEIEFNDTALYTGNFDPDNPVQDIIASLTFDIPMSFSFNSDVISIMYDPKVAISFSIPIELAIEMELALEQDFSFGVPIELVFNPIDFFQEVFTFIIRNALEFEIEFNLVNALNIDFETEFVLRNQLTEGFEIEFTLKTQLLPYNEVETTFILVNRLLSDTSSEVYNGFYFSKIHGMEP